MSLIPLVYSDRYKRKGTISIDLGSETTRCAISLKVSDHNNDTRERPIRPFDGGRHDRMDYSSLCNLTGSTEDEPYVGNDDTKNDSAVTIKLAIIMITGAKDDGLKDTPMMRVINEIEKNGDLKAAKKRAKRALNTLLTRISTRAKVVCDRDSCYISALGFSVPEQWSQSAHIYMENAIRSAFGLPADFQIMVLHEIDSNAQYYLDEEMARDTVLDGMKEQENSVMLQNSLILFVDAGGFSMNTCIHHVFAKKIGDETELFHLSVDTATGATGGSGHWNYNFRELCKTRYGITDTYLLNGLEDSFDDQKYKMDGSETAFIPFANKIVILQPEDITRTWRDAYKATITHFEKMVKKLARLANMKTDFQIIVTGGSSHQPMMMAEMMKICTTNELEKKLVLTRDLDPADKTLRLTRGLNLALKRRISVSDYIERGGAWAVVLATARNNMHWDKHASLILSNSSNHRQLGDSFVAGESRVRLDISKKYLKKDNKTRVKIVGFPFADITSRDNSGVCRVDAGDNVPMYDFLYLGDFRPGTYSIGLKFTQNGEKGELDLDVQREVNRGLGHTAKTVHLRTKVYHYVSAGCVLSEDSVEKLERKVDRLATELFGPPSAEADADDQDVKGDDQGGYRPGGKAEAGGFRDKNPARATGTVNYAYAEVVYIDSEAESEEDEMFVD